MIREVWLKGEHKFAGTEVPIKNQLSKLRCNRFSFIIFIRDNLMKSIVSRLQPLDVIVSYIVYAQYTKPAIHVCFILCLTDFHCY